jgi:4-hydroxybenzoate polyprenyltransferase
MSASAYVRLLRVEQWYKNLVVFFALFFTNNIFNAALLWMDILAFVSLCFLSSSYYILNDIRDREADRRHPEKRARPLASGEVSAAMGHVTSLGLLVCAFGIASALPAAFTSLLLLLLASSISYNMWLKDVAFVDLHMIAVNFLIRAVGGAAAIGVAASPWLVTVVFFSALLLAISKRRSELLILGEDAVRFKRVYEVYTQPLLDMLLSVVSCVLLVAYILYTFFVHPGGYMMLTIPFASFIVFRYLYFTSINHRIARKSQYLFLDVQILVGFLLWGLAIFLILYVA